MESGPYNDITKVYCAAVSYFKTDYLHSAEVSSGEEFSKEVAVRNEDAFNYKIDAAMTIEAEFAAKDKKKSDNPPKRKM
eukprot:12064612-Ditylum_brightwellii.AAC.1